MSDHLIKNVTYLCVVRKRREMETFQVQHSRILEVEQIELEVYKLLGA